MMHLSTDHSCTRDLAGGKLNKRSSMRKLRDYLRATRLWMKLTRNKWFCKVLKTERIIIKTRINISLMMTTMMSEQTDVKNKYLDVIMILIKLLSKYSRFKD